MSLKYRLWLSFAPLLLLLAGLGAGAVSALGLLGTRIDAILRENYRTVDAMNRLTEAAERIDSSFQFALAGRPGAKARYDEWWVAYRTHHEVQLSNVTEPGEAELTARLTRVTDRYRALGDRFFDPARTAGDRSGDYYGPDGTPGPLQTVFSDLKRVTADIRRLNQDGMERASETARRTAAAARWWAGLGLLAALGATGLLAWRTTRAVLRPMDDLARSARAVGDGRFDQFVTADTRDEVGELVAAFNRMTAQLRDLRQTQAARLLRAQQASQAAIDAFPDPVLLVDPGGRVEMANPAARRELGVVPGESPAALPWQPPDKLCGPLAAALRDQQPTLTRTFDGAVTYRAAGAEDRVYLPQVLPVRDPYGAVLGAAVVLNDVTRFRLLDEFKSDLVATASHELKTPLAGLRLAVHLLLEEAVGPLTDKQSELLIDARENTERLVKIVDHLLALARLEQGWEPLALRPEEPAGLLRAAAERVGPLAAGKRLVVAAADGLPPVAADADRLGHALDNLLVNATTYTDAGGTITLSARPAGGGRVELAVSDTGVGIPAERLPHVFDKFFRIPGQTRGGGTGLGLAIVKEVVTAHGGAVVCESEPGTGTTFRITLPAWSGGPTEGAI
ncbi:MAG: ATP-binding protein [Fimbriiglobus sp.]|jgi:signal transduction histidine kinase|nr:ATP-binding protein [Fimbriiglobus sp.]